jgi:ubiquinone/menaquinone biosynthesis C-methylase UbiE
MEAMSENIETIVQKQYNHLANIYDYRWSFYIEKTLSFLKNWSKIKSDEVVLDVACGTGEFERLILEGNTDQYIDGIDFSEQMLNRAIQKCQGYSNVSFQVASATELPCTSAKYDVVVCANAFHYFDQPEKALQEMRRVSKVGGRIIILDWSRDFLTCRVCDWFLRLTDPAHKNCYSHAELKKLLESEHFEIAQTKLIRFGWVWGLMAVTAKLA